MKRESKISINKRKVAWFEGKTFNVTGGSSGIGLAISQKLSEEGAKVLAISYNPDEFPVARSRLSLDHQKIVFFKCDITRADDRDELKFYLQENQFSLAGLINVAGITTYGPFFETPAPAIQKMIEVNFTGTILFTREIFPLVLNKSKSETMYLGFVSSTSGGAPMANIGPYPATKAGVEMFLRSLELECSKNVKILSIRPGPVKTNLYSNVGSAPNYNIQDLLEMSRKITLTPDAVASVFVKALKRRRTGIIYPNLIIRMMVHALNHKSIGKIMAKGMVWQVSAKQKKP